MIAIASPTWRTLSCANSGCCGLRNLCWITELHLLGTEICPSGTGGNNCKRSSPFSASATPGAARARLRSTPRIRPGLARFGHQLPAIHARQHDIAQQEVDPRILLLDDPQGRRRIGRAERAIVQIAQGLDQVSPDIGIVLDDQDRLADMSLDRVV